MPNPALKPCSAQTAQAAVVLSIVHMQNVLLQHACKCLPFILCMSSTFMQGLLNSGALTAATGTALIGRKTQAMRQLTRVMSSVPAKLELRQDYIKQCKTTASHATYKGCRQNGSESMQGKGSQPLAGSNLLPILIDHCKVPRPVLGSKEVQLAPELCWLSCNTTVRTQHQPPMQCCCCTVTVPCCCTGEQPGLDSSFCQLLPLLLTCSSIC